MVIPPAIAARQHGSCRLHTPGDYTLTIPANTTINYTLVGGGGGGGATKTLAGGAGGASILLTGTLKNTDTKASHDLTIIIAAGGSAGSAMAERRSRWIRRLAGGRRRGKRGSLGRWWRGRRGRPVRFIPWVRRHSPGGVPGGGRGRGREPDKRSKSWSRRFGPDQQSEYERQWRGPQRQQQGRVTRVRRRIRMALPARLARAKSITPTRPDFLTMAATVRAPTPGPVVLAVLPPRPLAPVVGAVEAA